VTYKIILKSVIGLDKELNVVKNSCYLPSAPARTPPLKACTARCSPKSWRAGLRPF